MSLFSTSRKRGRDGGTPLPQVGSGSPPGNRGELVRTMVAPPREADGTRVEPDTLHPDAKFRSLPVASAAVLRRGCP